MQGKKEREKQEFNLGSGLKGTNPSTCSLSNFNNDPSEMSYCDPLSSWHKPDRIFSPMGNGKRSLLTVLFPRNCQETKIPHSELSFWQYNKLRVPPLSPVGGSIFCPRLIVHNVEHYRRPRASPHFKKHKDTRLDSARQKKFKSELIAKKLETDGFSMRI